jgi:hypothetical protein
MSASTFAFAPINWRSTSGFPAVAATNRAVALLRTATPGGGFTAAPRFSSNPTVAALS